MPTVTDEMLEKVLQAAASPVFVEFTEADSVVSAKLRRRVEVTAEEFDDRVIFLRLFVDENPGPAAAWRIDSRPMLVVFKRGREIGRIGGDVAIRAASLEDAHDVGLPMAVLRRGHAKPHAQNSGGSRRKA